MKSIKTLPLYLVAVLAASIAQAQQLSPKELAAVAEAAQSGNTAAIAQIAKDNPGAAAAVARAAADRKSTR